jgi:uncharacterized repeat protein (TIGR03803 family)
MESLRSSRTAFIIFILCAATAIAASAQTFNETNFNFANGGNPNAGPMVQAANGNFFGIAAVGGGPSNCPNGNNTNGCGTVFELTPAGKLTALYSFCSQTACADGEYPEGALVLGSDGNLYGTTISGGAHNGGTVFKITPTGTLTTIYSFCVSINDLGICTDGMNPEGLTQGANGNFYGVTFFGGTATTSPCYNPDAQLLGCGTIFELTAAGKLTTLHNFCTKVNSGGFCTDGGFPQTPLVQAPSGNFYGILSLGGGAGRCNSSSACGSVFSMSAQGVFTTIYNFCTVGDCPDGNNPSSLTRASNGNFFGTTQAGGSGGGGTFFEITPAGSLTTLYGFCNTLAGETCPDGTTPSSLMQATDGNFYGTTTAGGAATCNYGGAYGCGTVFKMTSAGSITTLHDFCETNCYDGISPRATLAQGTNGIFYGLAGAGGADEFGCFSGCGTAYSLSVGLGPFVETNPTSGKVGGLITILGNGLKGTTSVSFNGTTATFTVVSNTAIKAKIPTGATTGTIEVTTPGGTLSSNVAFTVAP